LRFSPETYEAHRQMEVNFGVFLPKSRNAKEIDLKLTRLL